MNNYRLSMNNVVVRSHCSVPCFFSLFIFLFSVFICSACTPVEGDIESIRDEAGLVYYSVAFETNGGTPVPAKQTVKRGNRVSEPENLEQTDYTLMGWYTDNTSFENQWDFANDPVTNNITLYAKWNAAYTVTYGKNADDAEGTTPDSKHTVGIEKPLTPCGFTRKGYAFIGWTGTTNGGVEFDDEESVINLSDRPGDTVRLYAVWSDKIYTVVYNKNADNAEGTMTDSVFLIDVSQNISFNTFTRTGYTFSGWAETSGGAVKYEDGERVVNLTDEGKTKTLYAKWNPVTYTVVYDKNAALARETMADSSFTYDEPQNLRTNSFLRDGYTFGGWARTMGGDVEFTNGQSVSNLRITAGTVTLYAVWNPISYTVIYNANGGTGTMAPSSRVYNDGESLPACDFDPSYGDIFAGRWNDELGTSYPDGCTYNLTATAGATVTLYAQWIPDGIYWSVLFETNGGSSINPPNPRDVLRNTAANRPSDPAKTGYTFAGWFSDEGLTVPYDFSPIVTADITLYAKWDLVTNVPGADLAAKLSWLQSNALSGVGYTVEVSTDENISPHTLAYSGRSGISITLKSTGAARTVGLLSPGSLFTVGNGVTLVLENNNTFNITLQGRDDNTASLVRVNSGGTLVMNTGSLITGNTIITTGSGGGVYVDGGTFTMNGGKISGNTATVNSGGGVYVIGSNATFTMSGGEISGNETANGGGGVRVDGGTFTVSGDAKISGNTSRSGGGVDVNNNGTFTMSGGEIFGNTTTSGNGGGVDASTGATFDMSGNAKIYGNTAANNGGGVGVGGGGGSSFIMRGDAKISGNEASATGGGVYVGVGNFEMKGTAKIYDNTSRIGGGVRIVGGGTFTMSGGTISGNTSTSGNGGGVDMNNDATFDMSGGTIGGTTPNTAAARGGGVSMGGSTSFTMSGGTISGNIAATDGGGVFMYSGTTFTMSGGTIGGTFPSNTSSSHGGGVFVGGTFTMIGGTITGNKAGSSGSYDGGGVYVTGADAIFDMSGGEISNNESSFNGGGVYVGNATFTMSGDAKIFDNTANQSGGGVYVNNATFIMSDDAKISGNTAIAGGGGVRVYINGTFRIVNGTVYGNESGIDQSLRNTANGWAALELYNGATAQRGTFDGTTWNSLGSLSNTNNTIKVVNGEIVP